MIPYQATSSTAGNWQPALLTNIAQTDAAYLAVDEQENQIHSLATTEVISAPFCAKRWLGSTN
jgi:hypothetical protein